jgi:uncharacterized protein YdaU (DUF1376 family)
MNSLPYIRWNPGDYFKDAHHLTTWQHGAYYLLLMAMWSAGGRLPAKPRQLAEIAKATPEEWAANRAVLMRFFEREGPYITKRRITAEIAHVQAITEKRRAAGKSSAEKTLRKNKGPVPANAGQTRDTCRHMKTPAEEEVQATSSSDRSARASPSPADRQAKPALGAAAAPFDPETWQARQIERLAARQAGEAA